MQLLAVEFHTAVLESCSTQLLGQCIESYQLFGILALIRILLCGCRCRFACTILYTIVFQYLLNFFVSIAAIALNYGVCQVPILDISLIVHLEDYAIAKFFFVRTKRADKVTESLWQHRYGAVNQIDTGCTSKSFLIDSRSLAYIMRYVGDMNTNLPQSVIQLSDTQCIVKVLGVLRVDGAGKHFTKILATGYFLCRNSSIYLLSSLFHILRILIRQVILSQYGVHLCIVLASLTQYINYTSDDVLMLLIGPLYYLNHSLVVGFSALKFALGYDDIVYKGCIRCYQEGHILLYTQLTYDSIMGSLNYLNNHSLLDMLVATSHQRYFHAIAVHCRHRVSLGHEYRRTAIIGHKRVATVGFSVEHALLHLSLQVKLIRIVANLQQEVVPCHLFHHIDGKHFQRMSI